MNGRRKVPVPVMVKSLSEIETFIAEAAWGEGVNTTQRFPFMIENLPQMICFHVVDDTDDAPHSTGDHERSRASFWIMNQPVRMLGFYSDKHYGVFTHHGGDTHVRVETVDKKMSRHLDGLCSGSSSATRYSAE